MIKVAFVVYIVLAIVGGVLVWQFEPELQEFAGELVKVAQKTAAAAVEDIASFEEPP